MGQGDWWLKPCVRRAKPVPGSGVSQPGHGARRSDSKGHKSHRAPSIRAQDHHQGTGQNAYPHATRSTSAICVLTRPLSWQCEVGYLGVTFWEMLPECFHFETLKGKG